MEFIVIIILIIIFGSFIKFVPANTVIIVDRNSHYLKTKRSGMYLFNPATDKVTTKISTNHLYKYYTNDFETHDGKIVRVSFNVEYHAENLNAVLESLKSVRRSVDDIMNSSVYWAVRNLSFSDFYTKIDVLENEIIPKLLSEAIELNIKIDKFFINSITDSSNLPNVKPFKPHLNSFSRGPIKYK